MIRKFLCAAVVACVTLGVAMADEFSAVITKVDSGKITFYKTKKGQKEGDAMTLPIAKDLKVVTGKKAGGGKIELGDAIKDGLKNDVFTKITEKGVNVRLYTSDDNKEIKQVAVTGPGKKDAK